MEMKTGLEPNPNPYSQIRKHESLNGKTNHLLNVLCFYLIDHKSTINIFTGKKSDIMANLMHYYKLFLQFEVIRFTLK